MSIILEYAPDMPPEVVAAVRPHLQAVSCLFPPWCQRCEVTYSALSDDLPNAAITATVDYAYRVILLTFTGLFLTVSEEERRWRVVHDVLHASTCILADYAADVVRRLTEDDKVVRKLVMDELRIRHEAMTQDLAYVIHQRLRQET